MKIKWSKSWKESSQSRKQRKYLYNLPLHLIKKIMRSTLSKELRKKYNKRNIGLIKGDKVKIMRGTDRGKVGKVSKVSYVRRFIQIEGFEIVKRDGAKVRKKFNASNLMITELNLDDKRRKIKIEDKKNG
ncbi:MAG TPA: 50S ribosomal protein L24 [Candidatus Nanoarchaeia archaeon]|nr:50S ribosomal protein L24 [Candidatus Nanoarchaeia archaeon]